MSIVALYVDESLAKMPDELARMCEPSCKDMISYQKKLASGRGELTRGSYDYYVFLHGELEDNIFQYALPCIKTYPNLHACVSAEIKRRDQINEIKLDLPMRQVELSLLIDAQTRLRAKMNKINQKLLNPFDMMVDRNKLDLYYTKFMEGQKKKDQLEQDIKRMTRFLDSL